VNQPSPPLWCNASVDFIPPTAQILKGDSLAGLGNTAKWFLFVWRSATVRETAEKFALPCDDLVLKLTGDLGTVPRLERNSGNKGQRRKKGKPELPKLEEKLAASQIAPLFSDVNAPQQRISWQDLPASVSPAAGELPGERIDRKMDQIESLFWGVSSLMKPGDTIVDFCCGGVLLLNLERSALCSNLTDILFIVIVVNVI